MAKVSSDQKTYAEKIFRTEPQIDSESAISKAFEAGRVWVVGYMPPVLNIVSGRYRTLTEGDMYVGWLRIGYWVEDAYLVDKDKSVVVLDE